MIKLWCGAIRTCNNHNNKDVTSLDFIDHHTLTTSICLRLLSPSAKLNFAAARLYGNCGSRHSRLLGIVLVAAAVYY